MGTIDGHIEDYVKVKCLALSLPEFTGKEHKLIMRFDDAGFDILRAEIEAGEIGDVWQVDIIEMTESELMDLPEFEGW